MGDPHVGIFHAVESLEWGMVWTEGEGPSLQIVPEGEDRPFDGQTHLLYHAVLSLSHREIVADVQHGVLFPLHHLGQHGPQPSVWSIRL